MLFLRIVAVLSLIGIGASLLGFMLTGDKRYTQWAGRFFKFSVIFLFVVLALMAIERVILIL